MRKRIYSCLLAAVLLLSLVLSACTGKEPGVDRESTKESAAESTKEGKTDEGSKGADETGNSTESGDSGKPAQSDAAGIASALSEMKAGDGFTMGSYEQDGKDKNGAEPLTWTVIAQEPGKALVLSDYVIERMPLIETEEDYATCIWPDSTLRTWLNGEFLNGAFTDEEKALILPVENVTSYMEDYQLQETTSTDSVFLLSCEEYGRYAMSLGTVGYGIPTPYVVEKYDPYLADVEGVDGITQAMSWWLRTSSDQGPINAASVYGADKTYSLYGDEVSYGRGVRPAMWLVWDKDFMEAYEKGDREPQKDEALEQKIAGAKPGSSLTFGKYDVDPRVGNGYEDLTWTVIDETDSALLIINDQVYFSMKFMDMTEDEAEELSEINWEMSDIRKTLNSSKFLNEVFTPQEKSKILKTHLTTRGDDMWERGGGPDTDDYIFLPDYADMEKYFPDESSQGIEYDYWLRSPGFVMPYMGKVYSSGGIGTNEASGYCGVRMMMWIQKDGDASLIPGEDETKSETGDGESGEGESELEDESESTGSGSEDEKEEGKTGSGGTGSDEGTPGSQEGDDNTVGNIERPVVESKYHFDSTAQAKIAMETGLSEYRANLRGDINGEYTQQIENKYINHYLIPYLEVLQKEQHLVDPSSVNSEWFSEENDNMKDKAEDSSYGNIYKKYAQDMLPYMLPDPDDMLDDLLAMFKRHGYSGDDAGKCVDPAAVLEDYNNYDPKWYEPDWTYNWEELNRDFHYCYPGSSYYLGSDDRGASISFIAPRYNEHYFINTAVFGPDDDENYMTIEPYSNASNLLTEIEMIRDLSPAYVETYIQEIYIGVTAGSEAEVDAILREALAIINPYNSETNRQEILASAENDRIWVMAGDETDYEEDGHIVYDWNMQPRFIGHEELLRYDPGLEYWTERDYTPTWGPEPLYNLNTWSENPYSPGYMTDGWCSYFNHTCDQHVDYRITGGEGDGYYTKTLTIRYAGPTANAMNERYMRENGGSSVADFYGIYYPLILPIYYNEAAKNGYFTPYVVPEAREDEDLGSLIPDYGFSEGQYSEDNPYVSTTELESETERMTRHLREGYSEEEKHGPLEGWQSREKMDMTELGYTRNEDGTYTREMSIEDKDGINLLKKYTLTYDETGLLISGYKEFTDGTTRTIDFKTDAKGNPIESIDRYYDQDGNMYAHSASSYWPNGGCSSRTWYSTEVVEGAGGYRKLENVTYDTQGNMTSWTKFNPNGSPAYQKVISRWTDQAAGSTVGTLILVEYTLVTDTEHDEYGNVINSYEKQFAVRQDSKDEQKQRDALYDYLEDKTGVRRGDWP